MVLHSSERADRFVVQRCLGAGTTGSVYSAYDNDRKEVVAIKVLERLDPGSLFRFKGEFRQLTHVTHRNLLQLHELTARGSEWILSMELIDGSDFLNYVRPSGVARRLSERPLADDEFDALDTVPPEVAASLAAQAANEQTRGHVVRPPAGGALDVARLRSALRQLAEGLRALHTQDRLHRDLKPANVLVSAQDGRVVICDFGLVMERQATGHAHQTTARFQGTGTIGMYNDTRVAGTLAYMSLEQAKGSPLDPASDWFAIGVMLYEALTGVLPFDPRLSWPDAIRARSHAPIDPRAHAPGIPSELADLALALLDPEPSARPGYSHILSVLGENLESSLVPPTRSVLIGREEQLAQLHRALDRARDGDATVAFVSGRSGMGKSSLMEAFVRQARDRHEAVVLTGRCYEREDLPFKAIDPLMDALSSYLLELDPDQLAQVLPEGMSALARVFPVLSRLPAISKLPSGPSESSAHEQRRVAFDALRELCRRLSKLAPLVLYIDDLQWGDFDSGPLLAELLRKPRAPAMLLVGAYRSEDEERAVLIRALRDTHLASAGIRPVEIAVGPLPPEAAKELASELLHGVPDAAVAAELVTAEAAGSPLFVGELAAHIIARGLRSTAQLGLDGVIESRVLALPAEARQLLSMIVVAGRPERKHVINAALKRAEQTASAYRLLESQNFVHSTGADENDRVETYHDRIRETVYRMLPDDERRALHRSLALAIETIDDDRADPDELLEHWRAADNRLKSAEYAQRAAQKAEAALAFARSAQLYQLASELSDATGTMRSLMIEKLATALSLAGHGPEAADAYLRAITGASDDRATELRCLATTQLFRAGLLARGFEVLKSTEELLGMRAPTSTLAAIGMLIWRRLLIRLMGLRSRGRGRVDPSSKNRQRMDLLWGIAGALSPIDQLRGGVYQAEHLRLALKVGDKYRLARAFAMETTIWSTGNSNPSRTQWIMDRGLELAGASGEAHAMSAVKGTAGVSRMLEGRFLEAIRLTEQGRQIVRERLRGALVWDDIILALFELRSRAQAGQLKELIERVPEQLREAQARGDLYASVSLRTSHCCWAWLGPDQLEQARAQVESADREWVQQGYHLQHWYATQAVATIALYEGKVAEARARLAREWKALFMLRKKIQFTRAELLYMRGRLELAAMLESGDRTGLARVRADGKALIREQQAWILPQGRLLLACADSFVDRERALATLAELEGQFEAVDMKLHAAVCAYRRGQLLQGGERDEAVAAASAAMRELGAVNPEGFARLLAPGSFEKQSEPTALAESGA
jgi:eukaryotic-like serine/threonine-protein kinase